MPRDTRYRLLYVVPTLDVVENKGVLEVLYLLISHIDPQRYAVYILAFYSVDSDLDSFEKLGAEIHVAAVDKSANSYLSLSQWAAAKIREIRPHVVHTHLFWADTIGREAAIRCKVPVVMMTEHNTNVLETPNERAIKKRLSLHTDAVVCITRAVRDYSIDMDGIPAERISVIPNGFNFVKYGRDALENMERLSNKFYFIGRFVDQKKPLALIEAFSGILEDYPEARLVCIGDGPLLQDCKRLVEQLGRNASIFFEGYQENPFEHVQPGSILVLNSAYEGQGIVLLEAMGQGVICLAPDCGGIPEVITHNETGFLFKTGDTDSLKKAIRMILRADLSDLNLIRRRAHQTVIKKFRPETMATKYTNLYQRLLQEKLVNV